MPNSSSHSLGRVSIVPKGAYDSTISYNKLDLVMHDGSAFLAKKDIPVGISITNTDYWMEIASHGTPSNQQVSNAINQWAATNIDTTSGYVIDNTLTLSNFAADAKAVGDLWDRLEEAHADELEDFNDQKAEEFDRIILVSDTEPDDNLNKIWLQPREANITIPEMSDIDTMAEHVFADSFDDTQGIYSIGDYVIKDRVLYKAIANIDTADDWNASEWSEVNFTDELKNLKRRVSMLESYIANNGEFSPGSGTNNISDYEVIFTGTNNHWNEWTTSLNWATGGENPLVAGDIYKITIDNTQYITQATTKQDDDWGTLVVIGDEDLISAPYYVYNRWDSEYSIYEYNMQIAKSFSGLQHTVTIEHGI